MLNPPEFGIRPSINKHNCRMDVVADWVEGSAIFTNERVSRSDIVDILCENHVYRKQDFAAEFVSYIWEELRRRAKISDACPILIEDRVVRTKNKWTANLGYSFCLILSCFQWYPSWAKKNISSYNEQGELFERLTEQSLVARGWKLIRTGWSSQQVNKLTKIVENLSVELGEPMIVGGIGRWTKANAKDAGLDLVCERPFGDARGGRPLFFFQCASGANWTEKRRTPDLGLWKKLLDFSNNPQRGFALPFALSDEDFLHTCGSVNGMVLDRHRLVSPIKNRQSKWDDKKLGPDLKKWLMPRVRNLPAER